MRSAFGLKSPTPPKGSPPTDACEAGLVEARPDAPPELEPRAPVSPARELSEIAGKADHLEAIKKAVDDAAAVGGGLWLFYMFVLFYLAVAAGAVRPKTLLQTAGQLPFRNIELPLLAFSDPVSSSCTPTLVHLVFLTDKAKSSHQALHNQIELDEQLHKGERKRRLALEVPSGGNCSAIFSSSFWLDHQRCARARSVGF